jgi:hypothetical protein
MASLAEPGQTDWEHYLVLDGHKRATGAFVGTLQSTGKRAGTRQAGGGRKSTEKTPAVIERITDRLRHKTTRTKAKLLVVRKAMLLGFNETQEEAAARIANGRPWLVTNVAQNKGPADYRQQCPYHG